MATGHALSVLANNSIKSPVDVRSGKVYSHSKIHSAYNDYNDAFLKNGESGIKVTFGPNGDTEYTSVPVVGPKVMTSQMKPLTGLTDEEFYERLSEMKEHQRETLEKCEKLYLEKKALEEKYGNNNMGTGIVSNAGNGIGNGDIFMNEDVDIDTGTMLVNGNLMGPSNNFGSNTVTYSSSKAYDNIRDLSSKPPIPPSPVRPPSRQGKRPTPAATRDITHGRYSSLPPQELRVVRSRSLDGGYDKYLEDFSDEDLDFDKDHNDQEKNKMGYISDYQLEADNTMVSGPFLRSQEVMTPSKLELARIDSMFDNFTINDYMPRQRPSSAPASRRTEKQKKASEWRHKLTIPQPFNMTLRDESKDRKKTTVQMQVEQDRLEKEMQEELECAKKFRAKPVPAHIYLPLYDEINEKSDARRRYAREYSKELLKSQEKPFTFMKRENQKHLERRNSEPITNAKLSRKSKTFKANPVPSFVYEDTVSRKQREEEEYRKLRITMRSEELLKEASLPPSMAAREKSKAQKKEEMKRQARARKQFRPKIHRHMPDYDVLYKKFQRELARKKTDIQPTVVEPFRLETNRIQPNTEKILRDIARDEEVLTENRWPYRTPRGRTPTPRALYNIPTDSIPAKMTRATDTRNATIRKSLDKTIEDEKRQLDIDRKRRLRESKLRQSIRERAGDFDKDYTNHSIESRLRRFKEDERLREEQYQSEIEAMKEKVEMQPMLFERQRQISAKKKAEKKFADKLRSVGLSEDFVNSKSSATSSIRDGGYDDDDDYEEDDNDETYVKTSSHHYDSAED